MRSVLEDVLIDILKNTVEISRETKIFTMHSIAKNWGISHITMYRYTSPEYRKLSRETSRKAHRTEKKIDKSKCYKCKRDLKTHDRCKLCTILLHGTYCSHIALKSSSALSSQYEKQT